MWLVLKLTQWSSVFVNCFFLNGGYTKGNPINGSEETIWYAEIVCHTSLIWEFLVLDDGCVFVFLFLVFNFRLRRLNTVITLLMHMNFTFPLQLSTFCYEYTLLCL